MTGFLRYLKKNLLGKVFLGLGLALGLVSCGSMSGQLYFSTFVSAQGPQTEALKTGSSFNVSQQLDTSTAFEGTQYSLIFNVKAPIGTVVEILLNNSIVLTQTLQSVSERVNLTDFTLDQSSNSISVRLTYAAKVENAYSLTLNKQ